MEKHYKLLASQVGNLASRIASPKLQKRFFKAATTHADATSLVHPEVQELRKVFLRCRDVLEERLDALEISRGLEESMEMVFEVSLWGSQAENQADRLKGIHLLPTCDHVGQPSFHCPRAVESRYQRY